MKELTKDFKDNEVHISEECQEKKSTQLIGKQRKIPGLTTWEYNGKESKLDIAKYKTTHVEYSQKGIRYGVPSPKNTTHMTIDAKEGCYYFQALNKKNAVKHLRKIGMIK